MRDVTAGLAIAAVALPIGVAYPAIAGLPPVVGLYASILPLVGYAIFGSSRQLIVGPDAATLTILAASLSQLPMTGSEQQRAVVSAAFAIAVGVMLSGAFRLGFIANFLSRPILTGYLCGISLALLTSQIGRLTTVSVEAKGVLRPLITLGGQLMQVHMPTLVFGMGILLLLRLLRWWSPRAPGPLVAVIVGTLLSFLFNLESFGISLVGQIPADLPNLTLLLPKGINLDDLALEAFGILVVSFGSGIVTARSFGAKNRYRVDANRELIGFGAANIASGLFGGFPVSGADSRTAINDAVGGRTQVAGLVAAAVLTLVLVALTDAMKYLPVAALGAVIASAALDLFREGASASLADKPHRVPVRANCDAGCHQSWRPQGRADCHRRRRHLSLGPRIAPERCLAGLHPWARWLLQAASRTARPKRFPALPSISCRAAWSFSISTMCEIGSGGLWIVFRNRRGGSS